MDTPSFNKWFGQKFWNEEIFTDMEDMRTKSIHFGGQYNARSVWIKKNKELESIEPVRMLKGAAEINLSKLPLTDGKVHFIRQVNNDGQINVLNEAFNVSKEFISEYVWATICLGEQRLEIYYQTQDMDVVLIKEFSYCVNEEIRPLGGDFWNIC